MAAIEFLWDDSQLARFWVLGTLGQGTWVVLAIAATVALYQAHASRIVVAATFVSVLFATHAGPAAAVGLVALFVAELLSFLSQSGATAPSQAPEAA